MRKLLGILFIGVLLTGCAGSKGCGCPSWGDSKSIKNAPQMVMLHDSPEDMKNCN
jgi:hypothetical protein